MNAAWKTFVGLMLPLLALSLFAAKIAVLEVTDRPAFRKFGMDGAQLPEARAENKAAYHTTFLFAGDGNFDFGTIPANDIDAASEMFHYTYPVAGVYLPYLETTLVYDDTKDPKYARPGSISANELDSTRVLEGSSLPVARVAMAGKAVRVQATRRVVSGATGDSLTYIVTVENNLGGETSCFNLNALVDFHFDSDVMVFTGIESYPNLQMTDSSTANKGVIHLKVENLDRFEQRNIFLGFKTKDNLTPGPLSTVPYAVVTSDASSSTDCPAAIPNGTDDLSTHTAIELSHDPNIKKFTPNEIDLNYTGDLVVDINFQNDGYAPASRVEITDPFDFYFWRNCPVLADGTVQQKINLLKLQSGPGVVDTLYFSGGKLVVKLENTKLRGLREPGYGHSFTEEETRGFLRFTIPATDDCIRYRYRCSAIANQASIVFDDNPPVFTQTAFLRFRCHPGGGALACNTCVEDTIRTAPVVTTVGSQTLIPAGGIPGFKPSEYTKFKWYPEDGLSAREAYNPVLSRKIVQDYTLVATKNNPDDCKRAIVKVPVRSPCDLKLKIKIDSTQQNPPTCPSDFFRTYTVTAYAVRANGDPLSPPDISHLRWQNGALDVDRITLTNKADTALTIAVTDDYSNCYVEQRVRLKPDPLVVDDDPADCLGNPIVSGGQAPYTYFWKWQGGQANTNTLDLTGKGAVTLTATDANGCTAVLFLPDCSNSTENSSNRMGLLAGAALALGAGAAGLYFFRKKQ